jgi:uncharacterized protein YbaR (Trm112 family)
MIPDDLLEILACPACKADIKLDESKSVLSCVACGRFYPIEGGIPDMMPNEAGPE